MVLPIIIPADRATMPARNPWTFRYVYACAGGTPLGAHTPCTRRKHLHGVIDCMVEVWISPVTFLLTLINRSNYSISIALRHRIYALHIAGIPNADVPDGYSVASSSSGSWGDTAFLGMETLVSEVSFLLNAVSVLTRSLSVTIL